MSVHCPGLIVSFMRVAPASPAWHYMHSYSSRAVHICSANMQMPNDIQVPVLPCLNSEDIC